ncbi:MAG: methionyl-tRNA formyltransferase [marine bacterium B5-7]|nr:MAG: methionyl-tRNA formyltransferase [marine bacterium B5-7]
MSRPKIIFAGTPEFAVASLDTLLQLDVDIVTVYCQPDRPAGRGRATRKCPVKIRAERSSLVVRQPHKLDSEAVDDLLSLRADLMIVVAYGLILPARVIDGLPLGCVNVHASLLPRWRGAAPIQRAIEAGDVETGITLMRMDRGLDTGPMLSQVSTPVTHLDTTGSLHDRLSSIGALLLADNLSAILEDRLQARPQDNAEAIYAARIDRQSAHIDWTLPASTIERQIRAFNPWPICWSNSDTGVLRLFAAEVDTTATSNKADPGHIIALGENRITVACGQNSLAISELQKPGGKRLQTRDFLNGTPLRIGQKLD